MNITDLEKDYLQLTHPAQPHSCSVLHTCCCAMKLLWTKQDTERTCNELCYWIVIKTNPKTCHLIADQLLSNCASQADWTRCMKSRSAYATLTNLTPILLPESCVWQRNLSLSLTLSPTNGPSALNHRSLCKPGAVLMTTLLIPSYKYRIIEW